MQDALFDLGPEPPSGDWVYAIGAKRSSIVKIGHGIDIVKRLGGIQVGNPAKLYILWRTLGGRPLEELLHERFARKRVQGEWFDFGNQDPVAEISAAAKQLTGDPGLIGPPTGLAEFGWLPKPWDPDRNNPRFQPDENGCREATPAECAEMGLQPNAFARICTGGWGCCA
jgi:hypothetical protein